MSVLILNNSTLGAFKSIETKEDRLTCDGVDYPFSVIGEYTISEDDSLAPLPPPNPEIEEQRIASLWQAAHDYEYASLNGSAIGLVTLGILQAKPKCLAVQSWTAAIWTEYYTRKANGSTDTDFTTVGICPHTIPELMLELGL